MKLNMSAKYVYDWEPKRMLFKFKNRIHSIKKSI